MNQFRKLLQLRPIWTAIAIVLIHGALFIANKDSEIVYGDSGLMYVQTRQLIDNGYTSFAFEYPGKNIDPEYQFLPYTKPFLAKVGENYYIDFPPYFPLISAPFVQMFGYTGMYLPGMIGLVVTLLCMIYCTRFAGLGRTGANAVLILYGLGSSITIYNYVFHEYPLAIALWTCALLLPLKIQYDGFSILKAIGFGFFSALAIFFRMELILPVVAAGIAYVIIIRKKWLYFGCYSLAGFIVPVLVLLLTNLHIHGHALGLRYALTMTNNETISRWQIIYGLLFSDVRGMFRLSPFFLLFFLFPFAKLNKPGKFLLAMILLATPFILLTSPNDGDHIAPRYLFGIFAPATILILLILRSIRYEKWINLVWVLAVFLGALSIRYNYNNYKWIMSSDRVVRSFIDQIRKSKSRIVVSDGYGPALNMQNVFFEKKILVINSKKEKNNFEKKLIANNVTRFAIVGPLNAKIHSSPESLYKDLLLNDWKIINWQIDQVILKPPTYIVEFKRK